LQKDFCTEENVYPLKYTKDINSLKEIRILSALFRTNRGKKYFEGKNYLFFAQTFLLFRSLSEGQPHHALIFIESRKTFASAFYRQEFVRDFD